MPVIFPVPKNITVHLGLPEDTSAPNVTVPFPQYIKNVASSEIYPTWPDSAIRANMYAQITYALNRVFTTYYRSRGYDFDITNSTQFDQSYVHGRDIFENISQIADDIFNNYIVRQGEVNPIFARYCDGDRVSCPGGLSQWGTVELANQGYTPYEILKYYYGDDINIVFNAPVTDIQESYPGTPLRLGDTGRDVLAIQTILNRISRNYPAIPKIAFPDSVFDVETEDAVRAFQEIFNLTSDGIVGKATWYKLIYIYTTVTRLSELDAEGLTLEDVSRQFKSSLGEGDVGQGVEVIQYYLNFIAEFNDFIPRVSIDGVYGPATAEAVRVFQNSVGLPETGIVDQATWDALHSSYISKVQGLPPDFRRTGTILYPGETLRLGMSGENVRTIQTYLSRIADSDTAIPKISVTGYFGPETQNAVLAFQRQYGLPARGIVGLNTWNLLADTYADLTLGEQKSFGQYPGAPVSEANSQS